MARESVRVKGRRYVGEGRLVVHAVNATRIDAICRGGGTEYHLGHTAPVGWWCSCPARGLCAHLVALQLVTDRDDHNAQLRAEP